MFIKQYRENWRWLRGLVDRKRDGYTSCCSLRYTFEDNHCLSNGALDVPFMFFGTFFVQLSLT